MKNVNITLLALSFTAFAVFQSCKKDDDDKDPDPAPKEFVADDNTFSGFMSWSLDATAKGPDPALGGMAHGGNDSSVTRNVYYLDGQDPVGSTYPQGTVIVKHSSDTAGLLDEYTAMVKRGGNFNSSGGGWEYFKLTSNGKIANDTAGNPMRGAQLMGGMCAGCHAGASDKDFVYSK